MRLTNIAHLRLPFGRLWTYDVNVGATLGSLPVSFDQRRHVGPGNRPGSWMAISLKLLESVDRNQLSQAWLAVIARHGTLRSVFEPGPDGAPLLHEVRISDGSWRELELLPGQAVNDALRQLLDLSCTSYATPSHALCVLETAAATTVVIAADHAHGDMWSMLVMARDLLAALQLVRAGQRPFLAPVPGFAEHTLALQARPPAPEGIRQRWAAVLAASGEVMPRFPLGLGAASLHVERVEMREVLDIDQSAAFAAQAREEQVSTLALVVAAMTAVTLETAGVPLRAVFPVHSRYDPMWNDSVGWFITNSVLESSSSDPHSSAEAVREAVALGGWPLEDVLAQWGGMPEAPGMFAISWLDLRRLPVRLDAAGLEAQYVGASIHTDGVMLWFILEEAGLHLRCRYPDTPEAREHVGRWLDSLVDRLRSEARASVGGRLRLVGRSYHVQRATRADVPAMAALMSDDEGGSAPGDSEVARYEAAFDAVAHDSSHYLAVVRDENENIVGTIQLTIMRGLSLQGATRLHIEGVRISSSERSQGLGSAMLEWAHDHGRARGASLAQTTTDDVGERVQRFYERLGYSHGHRGLSRLL